MKENESEFGTYMERINTYISEQPNYQLIGHDTGSGGDDDERNQQFRMLPELSAGLEC